jgi:predicted Zn-dependent protease
LQNNLALLFLSINENAKALQSVKIALKSAPNSSSVQDTYGLVLLALGNNKEALLVLEGVTKLAPEKLSYKVHYAQALIANDLHDKAKESLSNIDEKALTGNALIRYLSAKTKL